MVNVLLWLLGGMAMAWVTCSVLSLGTANTVIVAAIIGIVGVIFGGEAFAPALGGERGSVLSPFAVLLASVSGMGCLKLVSIVYRYLRIADIDQRAANKSV
jgi:hypothetical protein